MHRSQPDRNRSDRKSRYGRGWTALLLHLSILIVLTGCQSTAVVPVTEWGPDVGVDSFDTEQNLRHNTFEIKRNTRVIGAIRQVQARTTDTLLDIARQFDLGFEEITAANPQVDPWLPKVGTPIVVPTKFILPDTPHTGIVLNLAALRLFYYPPVDRDKRQTVITYPIGIGREGWQTPVGLTTVVAKLKNPRWVVPPSIRAEHAQAGDPLPEVVAAGPDNPLGKYALRLGLPSYLIHGTNKPSGIGMRVSHGCIQLLPEDIAALFSMIPVGTPIRIVNEPYLAAYQDATLYLETHRPLEEDRRKLKKDPRLLRRLVATTLKAAHQPDHPVDWEKARSLSVADLGIPLPISQHSEELAETLAHLPVLTLPEPRESVAAVTSNRKAWYVNAGAFKNEGNARKLAAMIAHMGPPIPARYVPVGQRHQVLAGPFPNKRLAVSGARRIKASFGADAALLPPGT
jgi:L,D-transpeptidase ErfK/SrfK